MTELWVRVSPALAELLIRDLSNLADPAEEFWLARDARRVRLFVAEIEDALHGLEGTNE